MSRRRTSIKFDMLLFGDLCYLLLLSLIYVSHGDGTDFNTPFYLLSGAVLSYNLVQLYRLYRSGRKHFWITPMVLSFIPNTLFYLGAGSNFLLLTEGKYYLRYDYLNLPGVMDYMVYAMFLTAVANLFTWWGYRSSLGRSAARLHLRTFSYERWIGDNIGTLNIVFFLLLGIAFKFLLLHYGLYGRLTDASKTVLAEETSFLASQTRFLKNLSILPYTILCYFYFKYGKYRSLFVFALIFEIFFSLISGARGPIIMTLIVTFLIYYFAKETFKKRFILIGFFTLIFAMTIGQEFKDYAISRKDNSNISTIGLISGFFEFRNNLSDEYKERLYGEIYFNIAIRVNFVSEAAIAMHYNDTQGLDDSDPRFVRELVMLPINTVIPRFVIGVPAYPFGYWFKTKVLHYNKDLVYNIAFSPIGYLYFAGGPLLIFAFFFLYGVVLRWSHAYLQFGILSFLLYLALIGSVAVFKTNVPGVFINFVRTIVVFPIVFNLLFYRHDYRQVLPALFAKK